MKRCICNVLCIVTKWNDQPLPKIVISVACLIHVCDMTHSYVWHVSFMCATWLIHMCGMSHSCVRHDSFICMTRLIHVCDQTHADMTHMSHSATWEYFHKTIIIFQKISFSKTTSLCQGALPFHEYVRHDTHMMWDMTHMSHSMTGEYSQKYRIEKK